jgi:transglutaminase-like putative cysteine protease
MHRNRREAELLFATIYAGLPLYGAESGSRMAVTVCHVILGLLLLRALFAPRTEFRIPPLVLKFSAIAYLFFFVFDAARISDSLILASTHLVFFISVYQPLDPETRANHGQRLLIALLICITSLATSTSLSIVFFLVGFVVLTFRQLIDLTHSHAAIDAETTPLDGPPKAAAFTYLLPTAMIAVVLFPALPRVHNPFVRGFTGALEGSSTGLSDSIDFSVNRNITPDPTVVARVWMPQDAVPFFTPLRLRGSVYDGWIDRRWKASSPGIPRRVPVDRDGRFAIGKPVGFSRSVTVQQSVIRERRVYLPSGTHHVKGVPRLTEYGRRTIYAVPASSSGIIAYEAEMSRRILPIDDKAAAPKLPGYPISPRVAAMAENLTRGATTPEEIAGRIEEHLSTKFEYVPNPATLGRPFNVDEFLLRERRGHCEYFAAGMVVLLEARGVPSRIVGGFYGGKLNPLTGYFTLLKSDAHAWVEVWNGREWVTYDPTPASLRPGNQKQGLIRAYASALADSVNYFWDRYILTFGLQDQVTLLMRALEGTRSALRSAKQELTRFRSQLFSASGLIALVLVVAAFLFLRRLLVWRQPLFHRTLDELQRAGFQISDSTTPDELMKQVERQRPELTRDLRIIFDTHERERFSSTGITLSDRRTARDAFRRVVAVTS